MPQTGPMSVPAIAAALLSLAATTAVVAAPVTVNSSFVETRASDASGLNSVQTNSSTAFGVRSVAASDGGSTSTTRLDWRDTGSGALFDYDFDLVRTGTQNAFAQSRDTGFFFTVDSDTTYSIAGRYTAGGGVAGITNFRVFLFEVGVGTPLFNDFSSSRATIDEDFILGTPGDGDVSNATQGSLTGTLLAGRRYTFFWEALLQADPSDVGGNASGCVGLAIGGAQLDAECGVAAELAAANRVPEPGSLALAGVALAGLGAVRRRARRRGPAAAAMRP